MLQLLNVFFLFEANKCSFRILFPVRIRLKSCCVGIELNYIKGLLIDEQFILFDLDFDLQLSAISVLLVTKIRLK